MRGKMAWGGESGAEDRENRQLLFRTPALLTPKTLIGIGSTMVYPHLFRDVDRRELLGTEHVRAGFGVHGSGVLVESKPASLPNGTHHRRVRRAVRTPVRSVDLDPNSMLTIVTPCSHITSFFHACDRIIPTLMAGTCCPTGKGVHGALERSLNGHTP